MESDQILQQSHSLNDTIESRWNVLPFMDAKEPVKSLIMVSDTEIIHQTIRNPEKKISKNSITSQEAAYSIEKDTLYIDTLIINNEKDYIAATEQPMLFQSHSLKTTEINPQQKHIANPNWFTIIIIALIIAVTYLKVRYNKIMKQIIRAFLSSNVSYQIIREENVFVQRTILILHTIFGISGALFLYQLNLHYEWDIFGQQGESIFIIFICILMGLSAIKIIVLWILGKTFDNNTLREAYSLNIFLINNVLGLILIPVVLLIAYFPYDISSAVIYIGIGFVILSFLYRLAKGFSLWKSVARISVFYFILYLCTLEIAPLLVLFKLVQ